MSADTPDTAIFGSDLERRVLGNVPRFWPEGATVEVFAEFDDAGEPVGDPQEVPVEEHLRDVNGYDADWTLRTSMTEDDLLARIDDDDGAPAVSKDELRTVLAALADRGYVDRAGDAVGMTEAGLAALTS